MRDLLAACLLIVVCVSFAQAEVTYSKDIAPIVNNNCMECHRPGESAPFPLRNYEEVKRRARIIKRVITDGSMPPWHAVGGDVAIAGERGLEKSEVDLIVQWIDGGFVEGDPADLPNPPEFPEGWRLGEPDLILEMSEAYSLYAEGPDVYRNFVIPTGLMEDRWLKAIEFRPGAPSVVHHSLFYLDTTGAAQQADAKDPVPGFAKMPFGEGIGKSLGGWAPGMNPIPLPEGVAYPLPKGSDIILSTHFHPSGKVEEEKSTLALYFSDEPPSKDFMVVQLPPVFGAFAKIGIEPGDSNKVIEDRFELPVEVEAFGITGHAHYLGKSLRMVADLPDGSRKVLLNIPEWDFSWQEEYRFEETVRLPAKTILTSTVVWDNSEDNPFNPSYPPVFVRWGLESNDEMGSVSLLVTTDDKSSHRQLRTAYAEHLEQQATSHIASEKRFLFLSKLQADAIKRFDADRDGRLNAEEREKMKDALKEKQDAASER